MALWSCLLEPAGHLVPFTLLIGSGRVGSWRYSGLARHGTSRNSLGVPCVLLGTSSQDLRQSRRLEPLVAVGTPLQGQVREVAGPAGVRSTPRFRLP